MEPPPTLPGDGVVAPTTVNVGDPHGNMGLRGMFAVMGNATSMVIVALVMIYAVIYQFPAMHREAIDRMERLMETERRVAEIERATLIRVVDKNSMVVERLAEEMRLLRESRSMK